jgi:hypothetical protein
MLGSVERTSFSKLGTNEVGNFKGILSNFVNSSKYELLAADDKRVLQK